MPPLAASKIWKSWWEKLHAMSRRHDTSTAQLKEYIEKPPSNPEIAKIAATDMSFAEVEKSFGLQEAIGIQTWQSPPPLMSLSPWFIHCLNNFEALTRLAKPTEARSRCRIDTLLFAIHEQLKADDYLDDAPKVTLQFETCLEWGPIIYDDKKHKCVGKANYSFFFGEKNHTACHLVVLEAKQDNHTGDENSRGQLLAYLAMVRANRKARCQSNSSVWGVLSDGLEFSFYKLDHEGRWSYILLQVRREGWSAIANLLAHILLQTLDTAASPLRPSGSANPSAR